MCLSMAKLNGHPRQTDQDPVQALITDIERAERLQKMPHQRTGRTAGEKSGSLAELVDDIDFRFASLSRGILGDREAALRTRIRSLFDYNQRMFDAARTEQVSFDRVSDDSAGPDHLTHDMMTDAHSGTFSTLPEA